MSNPLRTGPTEYAPNRGPMGVFEEFMNGGTCPCCACVMYFLYLYVRNWQIDMSEACRKEGGWKQISTYRLIRQHKQFSI
jgi:hypothetical protein